MGYQGEGDLQGGCAVDVAKAFWGGLDYEGEEEGLGLAVLGAWNEAGYLFC